MRIEIWDDEFVFRAVAARDPRVPESSDEYRVDNVGGVQITSQAFRDPAKQPSFFIERLIGGEPLRATMGPGGAIRLNVGDLRRMKFDSAALANRRLLVVHSPNERNFAHGHLQLDGEPPTDGQWKHVRKALSMYATKIVAEAASDGGGPWSAPPIEHARSD